MKTVVLDVREMFTRGAAHVYIARKLSFPDYYGNNLDALHDCLTDISEPTQIVLYQFTEDALKQSPYLNSIIRVLRASSSDNKNLIISYDSETLKHLEGIS